MWFSAIILRDCIPISGAIRQPDPASRFDAAVQAVRASADPFQRGEKNTAFFVLSRLHRLHRLHLLSIKVSLKLSTPDAMTHHAETGTIVLRSSIILYNVNILFNAGLLLIGAQDSRIKRIIRGWNSKSESILLLTIGRGGPSHAFTIIKSSKTRETLLGARLVSHAANSSNLKCWHSIALLSRVCENVKLFCLRIENKLHC